MIQRRTVETTVQCQANFGWTFSREQLSPCYLLAAVSAPCYQGSFTVPPLSPGTHYDPPSKTAKNGNTVNVCSCSWAAYNLMSACTACQDQTSSIPMWINYREECGDLASNTTYWPSDVLIAGNHTIPFYAGNNPNNWRGQQFNVPEAKEIADQNKPDLTGAPNPQQSTPGAQKKSAPVGAIVGGTIGGVLGLALALLLAVCIRRRHRRALSGVQEFPPVRPRYFSSGTDNSEDSRKRIMSVASISSFGSVISSQAHSPNTIPSTMYTYDGTMQSFSQFGAPSMYTTHPQTPSHLQHGRVVSPAPTMYTVTHRDGPMDHIQPFTLMIPDESPDTLAHRRKEAVARGVPPAQVPVQSVPTSVTILPGLPQTTEPQPTPEQVRRLRGVAEEEEEHEPRTTRDRSQSQPPAYDSLLPTPSDTASSYDHASALRERNGHSHQPHGGSPGKGSQDSQTTWTSIGGVTDSTVNPNITTIVQPSTREDEGQTSRADPVRIARYRSVQSTVGSESRDNADVPEVA